MIDFIYKKKNFFNSIKILLQLLIVLKKFKNIYLIARKSKKRLKFKEKLSNIKIINLLAVFLRKRFEIKNTKILIISLSPYNFLMFFIVNVRRKKKIFSYF